MAAIAALLTSVLVFRMRGGYFAIGTWVLAEVFRIAFSNVSLLGGGSGQSLTVMAHIDRQHARDRRLPDRGDGPDRRFARHQPSLALALRARPDGDPRQRGRGREPGRRREGPEASGLHARLVRRGPRGRGLLHQHPENFSQRRLRSELGRRGRLHRRHRRDRHARGPDSRHGDLLCAALAACRLRDLVLARHGGCRGRRRRLRARRHLGIRARRAGTCSFCRCNAGSSCRGRDRSAGFRRWNWQGSQKLGGHEHAKDRFSRRRGRRPFHLPVRARGARSRRAGTLSEGVRRRARPRRRSHRNPRRRQGPRLGDDRANRRRPKKKLQYISLGCYEQDYGKIRDQVEAAGGAFSNGHPAGSRRRLLVPRSVRTAHSDPRRPEDDAGFEVVHGRSERAARTCAARPRAPRPRR